MNHKSVTPLNVLLIDDDQGICSSLSRILKLDGYHVDVANTAASALDRDNWDSYFAILLDRKLPDSSAEELLPQIRRLAPDASVLIVTGNADLDSSILAMRLGAADYLLKPVEPHVLRARLTRLAELATAKNSLIERDSQLEFMIGHLPAAAAYVDLRDESVQFNRYVTQITGYEPHELNSLTTCFERLFGDRDSVVQKQYAENRAAGYAAPLQLEVNRKDGDVSVIEFQGYRYDDHEVWLLHDMTERDRRETALRVRDQAIQSAAEGILIADAQKDGYPVIFANRAITAVTGQSAATIQGVSFTRLLGTPDDLTIEARVNDAIVAGEKFHSVVQCVRTDGSFYWNEFSIAPVQSQDGSITNIVCVMEDVTERRETEAQMVQSERLAAIGQMVTGLAHESRNALQRAQACLDMLSLDLEEQPEQLELTEKARRALTDLYRHYEEVRNYAAPINLERSRVSITKLISRTWRSLEADVSGRDFKLNDDGVDPELTCKADSHRLEQVFRNLMENSIAACADPGTICVQTSVIETEGTPSARIVFHDNGPGFPTDVASSVFVPFFTTKQKGTGLGMAIAKRIVDAHGGSIRILETTEPGATTEVVIPL